MADQASRGWGRIAEVTTPPQRPGEPGRRGRVPPPDPATERLPRPVPQEPPTEQIRARRPSAGAAPTERIRRPPPPPPPVRPPSGLPVGRQSPQAPPPTPPPRPAPEGQASENEKPSGAGFLNRQSIIWIALIVVALVAGGLAGAELYARHRADSILVEVAECVVKDGATISFGVNPPFLWQHMTGHYTNISVTTDGDRVQDATGMTADVTLEDVRLQETADSKGTIGSLNATLTWKSAGIKDTVAANLPRVGSLITGVSTDPAAGHHRPAGRQQRRHGQTRRHRR